MMKRDKTGLTKLELQVMQVIWRQGTSTVTEVQSGLAQELAYTTVQTMLNILERKGKLTRELQGRAFAYSAAVTEANAVRHAVRDLVDRMFAGSSEELVMNLIRSKDIDAERIAKLSKKLRKEGGQP